MTPLKILVLSQYFFPESFIINDLVKNLVAQGHEVVVATGKPNYPDGKIFPGYRVGGLQRERYLDCVDVVRVPLWPRGNGGAKNLILNYISFVLAGLVFFPWLLRKRKIDAILVFAVSPITQAIPAILLKLLKRAYLAVWIQDLWPQSLLATGFVKNRYALKLVGGMVRSIYACSDRLLVQSKAFIDPVSNYASLDKIVYYPNSVDSKSFQVNEPIPEELSSVLQSGFCVVFAGNLGTAQALDTIVQAAIHLRSMSEIRLVLIGSGSRLSWLQEQKNALGLENLILPGRFPANQMAEIFARSSALLVSLNDDPIFSQTIPSKIQAYLAAGRPIIASLNGEGARIVQESGAGLTCEAEQVLPLVSAILQMHSLDQEQRDVMGQSARRYFDEHFEMSTQAYRLVELLKG